MSDDKTSMLITLPASAFNTVITMLRSISDVVVNLNPNTPQPQGARLRATGGARAQASRGQQGSGPRGGPGRTERSTSVIAEEVFRKAGDGAIVTRGALATAFEAEGFSSKSAQTLLDRWVKAKKVQKVEAGKYKWVA